MVGAVVLAAGAGQRMGGQPKALLELDGATFLEHVVRTCFEGGCSDVWVVTRADAREVVRLAFELEVGAIPNPAPEQGMFSSVQVGVRAALEGEPGLTGVLLFPVDHPRVRSRTVAQLVAALEECPEKSWVQPGFEGRGGHPVALPVAGARALLDRDPTIMLREALRQSDLMPHIVPVDDPGVVRNVNTPEDLPGDG